MKKQVPMEIELMAHNGCAGSNPVAPFEGAMFDAQPGEGPDSFFLYEGREFTYAYSVVFPTNGFHCFRERVTTKPSKWALAQGKVN